MAGALISTTIPNLINGVSQQPYALRLASQCEIQENAYSSVVEGLRKRAGSKHIARITNAPQGSVHTHVINRDEKEQYLVIVGNGDLKVYDIRTGAERPVHFPNGKAYLSAQDPQYAFKAVTIADYTFIVNRTVKVAEAPKKSPKRVPEAMVWIRQGAYGSKYNIMIAGQMVTYETPNGSEPSHINAIQTDVVAENLRRSIQSSWLNDHFNVAQSGSTLHITHKRGDDFAIYATDSQGDQVIKLVKGGVQRFSDLPAKAFDGVSIEITGDQSSGFDNYFVTYSNDAAKSTGVWIEGMKGGEAYAVDAATMPAVLVRRSDGAFDFKYAEWDERKVGDLDSNPMPSFVGKTINDMFFHRNRLGFVADENVIFSRTGSFFNFFRSTATQVLATDPIDVAVSHIKVSILQHAVPFNETLLLFSEQSQFMLGAADMLSPDTISINQTTEFDCSLRARPVGVGKNIYFCFNRGNNSGLREYYVDSDAKTNDALDVTAHVPSYVPRDISKMTASGSEDVLALISQSEPNTVYLYKYYWSETEKLQSSWSKWILSETDKVLSLDFIESTLFLFIRRSDGLYIESIEMNQGVNDAHFELPVSLDRKVNQTQCTVTYNPTTERTFIGLPYNIDREKETFQIITALGNTYRKQGEILPFRYEEGGVSVSGQLTHFVVGRSYVFRYRFSTFVLKEEAVGGGQVTVGEGRIQLRKASLTYSNTGYFRVVVTPFRRDPYTYTFTGRVIGSSNNVIGKVSVESGRMNYPIMSKNDQVTIDIINDTFLPSTFLGAEWEALYVIRSKRI